MRRTCIHNPTDNNNDEIMVSRIWKQNGYFFIFIANTNIREYDYMNCKNVMRKSVQ